MGRKRRSRPKKKDEREEVVLEDRCRDCGRRATDERLAVVDDTAVGGEVFKLCLACVDNHVALNPGCSGPCCKPCVDCGRRAGLDSYLIRAKECPDFQQLLCAACYGHFMVQLSRQGRVQFVMNV
jgi:hypothetical protein